MADPAAADRERAVADLMDEHWPFSGGFTVEQVELTVPVVVVEYDHGAFLIDGEGGCWAMEEHILDNLPTRFLSALKELR